MKLLFVCTGNTCRSVLAHRWMEKAIRDGGLDAEARSAGIAADPSYPVPQEVRTVLAEAGAEPDFKHVPSRLDRPLADWADVILVMQDVHRIFIRREFPAAAAKTFLLREHAEVGGESEVPDPIGSGLETYRRTLDSVRGAVDKLAAGIPKKRRP